MKKVEAFIDPADLKDVQLALEETGIFRTCIMEAGVFVARLPRTDETLDIQSVALEPRVKLEMFLEDHEADRVAAAISRCVTGESGDRGRVFLTRTEESYRFRHDR